MTGWKSASAPPSPSDRVLCYRFKMTEYSHIAANLAEVKARIAKQAKEWRRAPDDVHLAAVGKTHPAEAIEAALIAGHRLFGENRVQEAKAKWPPLVTRHGGLELHLIGSLQSNKAREAVALFDAIHSLDRPSLAEALAKEIARHGRSPLLFVEINTGGEPQKAGVLPQQADEFLRDCKEKYGLRVSGLMCLPPADEPPAPHFVLTAKIARRHEMNLLSMGMSADFVTAIALGATHVRIGTAIFGDRK